MSEEPFIDAAGGGGDADRISALPDDIIPKILYLLDAPKQAARTSSLSRRWLHLWQSYPVLEFRLDEFESPAAGYDTFPEFTAASIRRLSSCRITPLDAFRLSLPLTITIIPDLDMLLASALGGADYGSPVEVVMKLDVIRTNVSYNFPMESFSNCSRTKVLKLDGCYLTELGTVSLQSLEVLRLENVKLTEQWLHYFAGNAPNLQSLSLERCLGLQGLEVSATNFPKLKTLEIQPRSHISGSKFDLQLTAAPFLQSLVFTKTSSAPSIQLLSVAPNLKVLTLHLPKGFTQTRLDDLISKLPSLDSLFLGINNVCNSGISKLRVSSRQLRVFELLDGDKGWLNSKPLEELQIDAPSLVNALFIFSGCSFPDDINVVNVPSDCRFVVKGNITSFYRLDLTSEWFFRLRRSLSTLSKFHLVLKLDPMNLSRQVSFDLNRAEYCTSPPLIIQRLQLRLRQHDLVDVRKAAATFLDGLFWACRPRLISMTQAVENQWFTELMYDSTSNLRCNSTELLGYQ